MGYSITTFALVGAGGALGSMLRYLVSSKLTTLFATRLSGTLTVNLLGCFLMGILLALFTKRVGVSSHGESLLAIGFLGGFTTFSTFAADVYWCLEKDCKIIALSYCLTSVLGSILCLVGGYQLIKLMLK